jgi:fatty acid desaturase
VTQHSVSFYAGKARRALPKEVFRPAHSRVLWLPAHLMIIGGATVAMTMLLTRGAVAWPFVLVLSLVQGVSFAGLTFLGHETLHGAIVRGRGARTFIGWLAFLPFVLSPRLWVAWHNRVHHGNTNRPVADPDAYPTLDIYQGSRAIRIATDYASPGLSRWRGLLALVIGFSVQSMHMLVAAGRRRYLTPRHHLRALGETALGIAVWATLAVFIGPLPFVFAFVIPLLVANVIVMAHILTNHSLSPLGDVNDPLRNTLTVTLPRWAEWITLSFGSHVEHHIFPAMSSRHAPQVRAVLQEMWPDTYQSMPLGRALLALHRTARVYKDEATLIDPRTGREWPALAPRRQTEATATL